MFKKYYKEANDDIKPDRELIDKIFERAEMPAPRRNVHKFAGSALVAAAAIVLSIYSYPQLVHFAESGRVTNVMTEGSAGEMSGVEIKTEKANTELDKARGNAENSEQKPDDVSAKTNIADGNDKKLTAKKNVLSKSDAIVSRTTDALLVSETAVGEKTESADIAENATIQSEEQDMTDTGVSFQSKDSESVIRTAGNGVSVKETSLENCRDEVMTIVKLPEDMLISEQGVEENGAAYAVFEGNGERMIRLVVSENADVAQNVEVRTARKGVYVAVFANEITSDELETLAESIAE